MRFWIRSLAIIAGFVTPAGLHADEATKVYHTTVDFHFDVAWDEDLRTLVTDLFTDEIGIIELSKNIIGLKVDHRHATKERRQWQQQFFIKHFFKNDRFVPRLKLFRSQISSHHVDGFDALSQAYGLAVYLSQESTRTPPSLIEDFKKQLPQLSLQARIDLLEPLRWCSAYDTMMKAVLQKLILEILTDKNLENLLLNRESHLLDMSLFWKAIHQLQLALDALDTKNVTSLKKDYFIRVHALISELLLMAQDHSGGFRESLQRTESGYKSIGDWHLSTQLDALYSLQWYANHEPNLNHLIRPYLLGLEKTVERFFTAGAAVAVLNPEAKPRDRRSSGVVHPQATILQTSRWLRYRQSPTCQNSWLTQ